jgi:type II secretory pathway component GspD/PulD (secretin)
MNILNSRPVCAWLVAALLLAGPSAFGATPGKITLSVQNTSIAEVINMLAEKERVNIVLGNGVEGEVSLNLYDVTLDQAVRSVARTGGYAVERHDGTYIIIRPEDAGKRSTTSITRVKTYPIQYSEPEQVADILKNHLSSYGKVTALRGRNVVVVEDTPDYLRQVEHILEEIDRRPSQILIEAKILQVSLSDSDAYGINWARLLRVDGGDASFGVEGLAAPGGGAFLSMLTPNIELALDVLHTRDRVRTLSAPKLLALEGQEASVVIGDRQGYKVTTTIDQVTTESIEFLESGVILKVLPRIDASGKVVLDIHPEVSTGSVSLTGIPSQTTTEVTTHMLAEDGQTVFIGGLIRNNVDETHEGVPVLGDLPLVGKLFSGQSRGSINTEMVVLITPYIVGGEIHSAMMKKMAQYEQQQLEIGQEPARIEKKFLKKDQPKDADTPERVRLNSLFVDED